MRANHLHTPAGLRDVLPDEYDRKTVLLSRLREVFGRFGYRGVESPMLEYLEVYSQGLDAQELTRLFDRDGATLALRADMTPPIARIAATAYAGESGPLRFCCFGNAFRENVGYQGKLREFSQAGVELLGAAGPQADGEVLALAVQSLLACGLTDFRIHVGHVEFFKGILDEAGLTETERLRLQTPIARRNFVESEAVLADLRLSETSRALFLALPRLVGGLPVLDEAAAMTCNARALEALEALRELYRLLEAYGVEKYVRFDLGMVNHLNYYTGVILRGYAYGTGFSLVDGGRYDNLAARYGTARPSVGFAIRINSLLDALAYQDIPIPTKTAGTLVAYAAAARETALSAVTAFRREGEWVETALAAMGQEAAGSYAEGRKMQRLLYFAGGERVWVTLFTEEGIFKLQTTLPEILKNLREGGDQCDT